LQFLDLRGRKKLGRLPLPVDRDRGVAGEAFLPNGPRPIGFAGELARIAVFLEDYREPRPHPLVLPPQSFED
jgi:hypothetical protein